MIGVPSITSRLRTLTVEPSMDVTSTRWRPTGLGRSADLVLKTPCCGRVDVVARVHDQHVTPGTIEPRQHQDAVAGVEALEPLDELVGEDELRVRRPLIALSRCGSEIDERRANPPDRMHTVLLGGHGNILAAGAVVERRACDQACS